MLAKNWFCIQQSNFLRKPSLVLCLLQMSNIPLWDHRLMRKDLLKIFFISRFSNMVRCIWRMVWRNSVLNTFGLYESLFKIVYFHFTIDFIDDKKLCCNILWPFIEETYSDNNISYQKKEDLLSNINFSKIN